MITIYGDSILDIYRVVEYIKPSPESTGKVYQFTNTPDSYKLGGAAAVAAICKHLGKDSRLVSTFADDIYGGVCRTLLNELDISFTDVGYKPKVTTYKLRHICFNNSGNSVLLPDRFDYAVKQTKRQYGLITNGILVISDYRGGLCEDSQKLITNCGARCIIVDPAIDRNWSTAYKGAHIIKCNRLELEKQLAFHFGNTWTENSITPYHEIYQLARDLNCFLVVTNGPKDIEIYSPDNKPSMSVSVPRVERVLDPTGCGDTITAALACFLDTNKDKPLTMELIAQGCTYAAIRAAKQTQSIGVNYDSLVLPNEA